MRTRDLVAVGVVGCVACCLGPILGVVAALGFASTLFVGVVGIALGLVVALVSIVLRRRRRPCAQPAAAPIPVEMSRRS